MTITLRRLALFCGCIAAGMAVFAWWTGPVYLATARIHLADEPPSDRTELNVARSLAASSGDERVEIRTVDRSRLADVAVRGRSAANTVARANRIASAYVADAETRVRVDTNERHTTAVARREAQEREVRTLAAQLRAVERQSAGLAIDRRVQARAVLELAQARTHLSDVERVSRVLTATDAPETSYLLIGDPILTGLRMQVASLEEARAALRAQYGPKHRHVQEVEAAIDGTKAAIDTITMRVQAAVAAERTAAIARMTLARERVAEASARVSAGTAASSAAAAARASLEVARDELAKRLAVEKALETGLATASSGAYVLDPAIAPMPYRPLLPWTWSLLALAAACLAAHVVSTGLARRTRRRRAIERMVGHEMRAYQRTLAAGAVAEASGGARSPMVVGVPSGTPATTPTVQRVA